MRITLKHHTPLHIAAEAIRECWQSQDKSDTCYHENGTEYVMYTRSETWYQCNDCGQDIAMGITTGPNDRALIERVGNKFKHASTLEHLHYNFHIEGISRACLQELARHRIASLSVKSTRYTLSELKKEKAFIDRETGFKRTKLNTYIPVYSENIIKRAKKYLVLTGNSIVDTYSIIALENLRSVLQEGISNDIAKYCLPEAYKTSLAWSVNARSLQNFLSLRSSKSALWEIRDLANALFEALPNDHVYLFQDCLNRN